jgi:hypothetical protein
MLLRYSWIYSQLEMYGHGSCSQWKIILADIINFCREKMIVEFSLTNVQNGHHQIMLTFSLVWEGIKILHTTPASLKRLAMSEMRKMSTEMCACLFMLEVDLHLCFQKNIGTFYTKAEKFILQNTTANIVCEMYLYQVWCNELFINKTTPHSNRKTVPRRLS